MTDTDARPTQTYDAFDGPGLDPSRWFPLSFPLPEGEFVAVDPTARVTVADGGVEVAIDRFTTSHAWQPPDNCKYLVLSTEDFALPEAGTVTFAGSLAAEAVNATPHDYRDGFASLVLFDPASGWVFDVCTSGDLVFAIKERLPFPGVENPFTRVVGDPLYGPPVTPGQLLDCEITIDTTSNLVTWRVDGITINAESFPELPTSLKLGMGIFTVHPGADGTSTSLRGQGLTARWRALHVTY